MKKIMLTFFVIVNITAYTQDTLLLKNGNKIPTIARKVHFLNQGKIHIRTLENGTLVGKNFPLSDIKYVFTRDTVKLKRIANHQNAQVRYFRYLDSSGSHIYINTFLDSLRAKSKKTPSLVQAPSNTQLTNALIVSLGPSQYASGKANEIVIDKTVSVNVVSQFSAFVEFTRYEKNGLGLGVKAGANFGKLDIRNADYSTQIGYNTVLISLGPGYHFTFQKLTIAAKLYGGLAWTQMENTGYSSLNPNYSFAISSVSILLNPSLDFYYPLQNNLGFFSSIGVHIYDSDIEVKRITSKKTEDIPKYVQPFTFFDYRIGLKFDF